MLLSIVSGTYNRLPLLKAMMQSVREQMPRHIAYQFVIVDGGSTDGTLEWLRAQPNIYLIEHGNLRGAIRAFCDGARMAQGEYVVMANDDIEFQPYGLMRAISHLEERRTCGAVAFADNRSAQVNGWGSYRVEKMTAQDPDGKRVSVNYAQVGMFRRWLGDRVGWWGDGDPIMSLSKTYGGDNYLSSRIWELGYSVDAVEGCVVDDGIARDGLRENSNISGYQDSAQYYARFPRGPQIAPFPTIPNPQRERLRILVAPIYEPRLPARISREQGLSEALARAGLTWELDYVNELVDLPAVVRAWQPHVLIVQMHDTSRIHAAVLAAARAQRPSMVVVNWNGDAHERGLIAPDILETLKQVDLQTVVNAQVFDTYREHGIHAAYWQIGYIDPIDPTPEAPAHDVLFLGNCYNAERVALVAALRELPYDVGIYGSCEGTRGSNHYDFAAGRGLYQRCKVAVSDTFPGTLGYVSNRLFQALAAGAFVLQQHSEKLDEYNGLRFGEHYIEWRDLDELAALIGEWLAPEREVERRRIAEAGRDYVRPNFSFDAQVRKLWQLLP